MKGIAVFALVFLVLASASCEQMNINPDNEAGRLEGFKQRNPSYLALFTAKWNADCKANLNTFSLLQNNAILHHWSVLDADVGTLDQWNDPTNYAKTDPLYKVQLLPTIYIISKGKITMSIIGQQIYDQNLIQQMLTALKNGPPALASASI